MHHSPLLNLLVEYKDLYPEESATAERFISFVSENDQCFSRSLSIGHVTGSAWIIDPDHTQCVLIHHRKLDRWLQPGGHADGCTDVVKVAFKEALEETGLSSLTLLEPRIFDIDIHLIPARGEEAAHDHYDVRFVFEADPDEAFSKSHEIRNIAWLNFSEVSRQSEGNISILRMIEKTKNLPGGKKDQAEGDYN